MKSRSAKYAWGRAGFLGKRAGPRAYGAKRVRVRIREKEGFKHPSLWRAPCFWGAKNVETARWVNLRARVLKALSLLRFFVALDKEMTRRHAQWLIVIKKLGNLIRPLTLKAATRHRLRPLTLEPGTPALTPTTNPHPQVRTPPLRITQRPATCARPQSPATSHRGSLQPDE